MVVGISLKFPWCLKQPVKPPTDGRQLPPHICHLKPPPEHPAIQKLPGPYRRQPTVHIALPLAPYPAVNGPICRAPAALNAAVNIKILFHIPPCIAGEVVKALQPAKPQKLVDLICHGGRLPLVGRL